MNPSQFQRVVAIFDQACHLHGDARNRFLDQACESTIIRQEVLSLLDNDQRPLSQIAIAGDGQRVLAQEIGSIEWLERDRADIPVLSGQYRIVRQVGEGGMGTVYEAEQARPRRTVALKALRRSLTSRDMLKRFERETHILGRLHHPGIAQIYEAGAADEASPEQAFFVMEFVKGEPLTEFVTKHHLNIRDRLQVMIKICDAVQHAHQRGVIHRDLKPSNILVNELGQPKVLDFGVAITAEPDPHLTTMHTLCGQMVGTLAYMSPEQATADADSLDTRTDVYALGVILYEALADRLPHDLGRQSLLEAMRIIREDQPPRLGELNPSCRGDLEAIVGRSMEKDKNRRYPSAAALAEDLSRYLNHQPIAARRPTLTYQVRKFARRHTGAFASVVSIVAALSIAVVVVAVFANRARIDRNLAVKNADEAHWQSYRANLAAASAALQTNDVMAARRWLRSVDEHDQSRWEWQHLNSRLDDSFLTLSTHDAAFAVAFNEDQLITGNWGGAVSTWNVQDQSPVPQVIGKHGASVTSITCGLDHLIATGSSNGEIRLWNQSGANSPLVIQERGAGINSLAFSNGGSQVVWAAVDGSINVWDLQENRYLEHFEQAKFSDEATGIAVCPTGSRIAACSRDGTLRVWDAASGREHWSNQWPWAIWSVAFSQNGRMIAVALEDKTIFVLNAGNGAKLDTLRGHTSRITALRFSPTGNTVASGSMDSTIRLWDIESGLNVAVLKGHTESILGLAWNSDGSVLASSAGDKSVRLWRPTVPGNGEIARTSPAAVTAVAFNPRGNELAWAAADGVVRLSKTDEPVGSDADVTMDPAGIGILSATFLPDGSRIVGGCRDDHLKIWNIASRDVEADVQAHSDLVLSVATSSDGQRIATAGGDGFIRIWDAHTTHMLSELAAHKGRAHQVAFSPDGTRIISCGDDKVARVWNAQDGRQLFVLQGHSEVVFSVTFSPDGKRVLTRSADGTLRWWDANTGAPIDGMLAHAHGAGPVVFHPDGTRLAVGTSDGAIRLFDAATANEVAVFRGHSYAIFALAFSPDGTQLASGSVDRTVRIWRSQPLSMRHIRAND